jgi:hypothetical protein
MLDPDLLKAYEQTNYWCSGIGKNDDFVLNINEPQPELKVVYEIYSLSCAAFLTACNPYSMVLSDQENENLQNQLIRKLESKGFSCLAGEGRARSGGWKSEPSVLVPGLSQEDACSFGREFQQNAIVWVGPDFIPKLLVLV